jgi:hypothetical protein
VVNVSWAIEELRLTAETIRERGDKQQPVDVWLDGVADTIAARLAAVPICLGFEGGCDGDLEGEPHIEACPCYVRASSSRPHTED